MEMNSDSHHPRSCSPCCAIVKNVKMLTISVILYDFKIKYFYDTYPLSLRCLVCYGAEAPVMTAGANVRNICIGSRAAARVRVSNEVAMFVSQLPSLHPRPISRPCNLLLRSLEMICRGRARTKDANTQKHRDDFLPRVSTAARPLLSDLDRAGLCRGIFCLLPSWIFTQQFPCGHCRHSSGVPSQPGVLSTSDVSMKNTNSVDSI